jgi:holliday junction DNA helicase RuvA
MIGQISGEITFSDGKELILLTPSGIGYQIYYNQVLPEGRKITLFISQIFKEDSQDLFGFDSLRNKKLFEMLITVKGVGPKSAYNLLCHLGPDSLIDAVTYESVDLLKKTPGVGAKTAAQIILDLKSKILKVKMYSSALEINSGAQGNEIKVLEETLMACKELGFRDDEVVPLAQKYLRENKITRAEQLIHLVLKGI